MVSRRILTGALAISLAGGCWTGCNTAKTLGEGDPDGAALRMRGRDRVERVESQLLVLDEDAIAAGREPNRFSESDVVGGQPGVGNRFTLSYFAKHVGDEITLPAGTQGDEGWFAFTGVRHAWKVAGPDQGDGLRNYFEAGPGLGSPDAKGRAETLLERVPGLMPLRATGLARLEGRSVCGIVLDGDVRMSYESQSGNIQGPNLGKVAFEVLSSKRARQAEADELPQVTVRILDAGIVCNDELKEFANAPLLGRDSPRDIERPSCVNESNVLTEEWNVFDTTRWKGDGDQVVEDGLFFARPGANSAAADYFAPAPVTIESTGAVRFSNRMQLVSDLENPFAESGALFLVNADKNGDFKNYVFVNVGYTMAPSMVFVELFGSDNGQDFDQFEQTSIPYRNSRIFSVDLWVRPNAYQIAVGGEMIDTVTLNHRLNALNLFEVGVQQNSGGLRGLIHSTAITQFCPKEEKPRCRAHWSYKGKRWKARVGTRCLTRNGYIRLAREKIKKTRNPSMGLRCLAKMREMPE